MKVYRYVCQLVEDESLDISKQSMDKCITCGRDAESVVLVNQDPGVNQAYLYCNKHLDGHIYK